MENEKQPRASWRLLITPPAAGAWNMAVDEAVLEAIGRGDVPATLRLYAWEPPCLSLGYRQSCAEVDQERLAASGWELVRRPTGGRAILHTDELTYAVIGPHTDPRLAGSLLESYHRLSGALLRALRLLAIPAEARATYSPKANLPQTGVSAAGEQGPVCFEVPSNYEITVGGKKLIGSAQARRREGVLQHGSLPLYGDLTRITQALRFSTEGERLEAADRLRSRALTAEEVLGRPVSWDTAAQAFREAFQDTLQITFQPGDLTPGEQNRAAELVREKFGNWAWTGRM